MGKANLIIRDAVHGDISIIEPWAQEIIDAPEFQRLKRIFQWAGGQLVFPSATHTRFTHCIGVYHVISLIVQTPVFQNYYRDQPRKLELVKLAGLLHDIGHGPFSHTFEEINRVFQTNVPHEQYSALLIKSPESKIYQILKRYQFSDQEINSVCAMIQGCETDVILNSLVSSQLDADRIDYLLRDSLYSGTEYGRFDVQWIIRHIDIDPKYGIVFPEKALYAVQNFLIGRFHMYKQVYYHPVSIGFNLTFRMCLQRVADLKQNHYTFNSCANLQWADQLLNDKMINFHNYVELDDFEFTHLIKQLSKEPDLILSTLAKCLLTRKIFKPMTTDKNALKIALTQRFGRQALKYFVINAAWPEVEFYNLTKNPIYIKIFYENNLVIKTLSDFFELNFKKIFANPKISFTIKEVLDF